MAPVVERIEEIDTTIVGECPYWDSDSQCLYFVDVFKKEIHKYVPSTRRHTKAAVKLEKPGFITVFIPLKNEKGRFVLSFGRGLYVVEWDGGAEEVTCGERLCEVDLDPAISDNNFCDGKCDPAGRLWIGTMGARVGNDFKKNQASLYCYSGRKVDKHLSNISISNGMEWDMNRKKYYHIDSLKESIDEFDYDINTNTISNRKIVFTLKDMDIKGFFDGMTIDTDGNLWAAVFGSYKILKIDPRKPNTLLDTIKLPAKQPTSVVFGGQNLDELYVTTASNTFDEELPPPWHGATYRITGVGSTSYPSVPVVL